MIFNPIDFHINEYFNNISTTFRNREINPFIKIPECCQHPGGGAEVIIKFEIFKVDTKLFQQCRQLSALLWVMVLLVKRVS